MESDETRNFNGTNNNLTNPQWGSVGTHLLRYGKPSYYGGKSELPNHCRPNPRVVSNAVCKTTTDKSNAKGLSDLVWAWGQFVDHEIDLSEGAVPAEARPFTTPMDDEFPGRTIGFNRTVYDTATGTSVSNPRQQINQISSYIDATNVYGADATRAGAIREFDGSGKLKTSTGNLLPFNIASLPNAHAGNIAVTDLFLAGDIRANEVTPLTCMHTLFMREHNRLCESIIVDEPDLTGNDEAIYQKARRIVGALMQVITYEEFLPAILGENSISEYSGYNDAVDAGINNLFSTACYRLGHSMLSSSIKPVGLPELKLRDMFFDPQRIITNGIEPFIGGLANQVMQEIDTGIVEDVRSFLFGPPTANTMLDLAALNIQRGRDHGLPDYNQCRIDLGLKAKENYRDITCHRKLSKALEEVYEDICNIDPWVGGLAEDFHNQANVGELIFVVLKDQFERLRDGDRFWYENDSAFSNEDRASLKNTKLSDVILRNTSITDIQSNVFYASEINSDSNDCGKHEDNKHKKNKHKKEKSTSD